MTKHSRETLQRCAGGLALLTTALLAGCVAPPAQPVAGTAPTALLTQAPPATATPVATPDAATTDITSSSSVSPDGRWEATTTVALPKTGDSYYTNLTVVEREGPSRWTVVDTWAPFGLGYTLPRPFHWSSDGRFLYVTNEPVPDGCALFVNGTDLARVDLEDGTVAQLVEPTGLWLSLSPDETQLAYLSWSGDRPLVVRNLSTGKERTVLLPVDDPNWQAGAIAWSPAGDQLALTVANSPCTGGWAASTSVVRVRLDTLEATALLQDDSRLLVTSEWPKLATLILQDQSGQVVAMDPATGEIEQKSTGTLQGHMSIGPLQPVVRADEPAPTVPPEAYAARQLIIAGAGEQTAVYRVQIGPDGAYQVALPPGTYTVDLSRVGMDFSKDLPATVEIVVGQTITLDVDVDTGIR